MNLFLLKLIITCTLVLPSAVTANSKEPRVKNAAQAENSSQVTKLLSERNYIIEVRTMIPQKGAAKALNGDYNLNISGDSVISYLPYYGRAYSIPYSGGEGLNFTGTIENYLQTTNKKDTQQITFTVKTDQDRYRFSIEVSPDGSALINVNSNNKQGVSFWGDVKT